MFDVGFGELLLIVLVILLLFGPQKLPDISRTLAKGLAQVRKAQAEFHRNLNLITEEIQHATELDEKEQHSPTVRRVASPPTPNGVPGIPSTPSKDSPSH